MGLANFHMLGNYVFLHACFEGLAGRETVVEYVYIRKGVRSANQANGRQLFQVGWPSSAPYMRSCSAMA